jgi:hypothetical protein
LIAFAMQGFVGAIDSENGMPKNCWPVKILM